MKIAVVTGDVNPMLTEPPIPGGRVHRIAAHARALAARGHQVDIYARRSAPGQAATAESGSPIRVFTFPVGPPRPLSEAESLHHIQDQAEAMTRIWRAEGLPDVVHACGRTGGLVALAAARVAPHLPLVQEDLATGRAESGAVGGGTGVGGGPAPPELLGRLRRLNALLARTSQGLLARSEAEEEAALRLGAPRENIRLIPSGVDTELFHPEAVPMPPRQRGRRPQAAEPKPGAGKGAQSDATAAAAAKAATAGAKSGGATRPDGSDSPRVLCLDGGGPARATAIAAIRAIPEARLTVAGGTAHEPVRRGRVELLGPVPHTAVPRLLADADVLVSTPDRDSGGSAALEAMACGVPVVATDVGALSDLVLDQITGLLVPPRRPDLVARAIRRVLHRSSWQLALGTAGRDRACARHDWDRVATETERFYLERIEAATAAAAA